MAALHHNTALAVLAGLDTETYLHCKRVQPLAEALGKALSLTGQELSKLSLGALLHDVGKQFIPFAILQKKEPLAADEWELIKLHPVLGWTHVEETQLDSRVKGIIRDHHMWANGQGGYPAQDDQVPCPLTQITTVADVADAMTSDRAYREALSLHACIDHLQENAATRFNREVVDTFITLAQKDFGFI